MSGPQFFQTGMGHTFYEGTLPRLAKALERIADAMEAEQPIPYTTVCKNTLNPEPHKDPLYQLPDLLARAGVTDLRVCDSGKGDGRVGRWYCNLKAGDKGFYGEGTDPFEALLDAAQNLKDGKEKA